MSVAHVCLANFHLRECASAAVSADDLKYGRRQLSSSPASLKMSPLGRGISMIEPAQAGCQGMVAIIGSVFFSLAGSGHRRLSAPSVGGDIRWK